MDYFSKFLKSTTQTPSSPVQDNVGEFHKSWILVKNTLLHPDERQLTKGIKSTDVPDHLRVMVDLLVSESTRAEEGATGACLEYLLKNDVLGTLVRLSETDRPFGIQAEVLRSVQNMVILMDEQFLVHSAVHKAVLRLLRNCAGDDLQEQLDNRTRKVMGAAGNAVQRSPSEYEEDLVNLLCILCSRIRTFRELLMIFFHDKHWSHSGPLFAVEEEDESDDDEDGEEEKEKNPPPASSGSTEEMADEDRPHSPTLSQETVTSAPQSSTAKKPEYEFLLFNYLLRFVHREGKIGEFARAGLLFLMDVAMSPNDQSHRMALEDGLSSSTSFSSDAGSSDPITDAALSLAEYILDGDFSDVLAAGLGAVYSLLPSKLDIRSPESKDGSNQSNNMVLGAHISSEEEEVVLEKNQAVGKEDSTNPDFKSRLDHFLKLLEFLEDVFRRNVVREDAGLDPSTLVGTAIVQSILDAVRRVFMENILYPSILECSDADGSAVAVMSYIDIIIRTLEHGRLTDVLVNFLLSEDNDDIPRIGETPLSATFPSAPPQAKSIRQAKLRRRRSSAMVLLEMEAPDSRRQSEYFTSMARFTLKDLLLSNLRSKDEPTATAALQLLQSLLHRHNILCVERLFVVFRDPQATSFPEPLMIHPIEPYVSPASKSIDDDEETFLYPGAEDDGPDSEVFSLGPIFAQPTATYATHEREIGLYLNLVSRMDPMHASDTFSTGYECYLGDAIGSIQEHISFLPEFNPTTATSFKHRLDPNDPILSLVLEWLRRFLSNKPESNIALTGILATLAYDPNRSLAGWLTFGYTDQQGGVPPTAGFVLQPEGDGDDRSVDYQVEESLATGSRVLPASSLDDQSRPVVHNIFQGLVAQLERYRQLIDDFDKYLLERRQGLLFSENLTDALALAWDLDDPSSMPQLRPSTTVSIPETPPKPKATPQKSSSIMSFLTPRKSKPSTPKPASAPTATDSPSKTVAASPFGPHYQHTSSVVVEPFDAPLPSSGPWQPARSRKFTADEEDVFTAGWGSGGGRRESRGEDEPVRKTRTITLSQLLDNVVILEESLKELTAIIHARRSLGIDAVRYL
ncbi:Retinoic acid induced 16-like protein-domain-containing protein [Amylostereum chailletii]|nr:Retinoic acid induced 16-like protein-domain-containing protein [Amylostereum chailletii]